MNKGRRIYFVALLLLIFLDRFSKIWVVHSGLYYQRNYGLSFGVGLSIPSVIWLLFFLTAAFILLWLYSFRRLVECFPGLLLLSAGFVGNLTDRFLYGFVVDFISLSDFFRWWPIKTDLYFNLADVYVFLAFLFLFGIGLRYGLKKDLRG